MSKSNVLPFKTAYGSYESRGADISSESITQQHHAKECDINAILEKFERTGLLTYVRNDQPRFGDFTSASDYHDSLNRVMAAQDSFMSLNPHLRARFDNDPSNLLSFLENTDNREEAIKLGLIDQDLSIDALQKKSPAEPEDTKSA